MSEESQSTRRVFLGSAALALTTGIAGCSNISGFGGNDTPTASTPSSTTSPTSSGTPTKTQTKTNTSTTQGTYVETATPNTPRPTPTPTPEPGEPINPAFKAMTGKTEYGIELTNSPVVGEKNAPLDIYCWTDYQCRYCLQFETNTFPELVRNEINNGTVRFVFQYLPNYGEHSWTAAVVAKCVWQEVKDKNPKKFWTWHHKVFENQDLPERPWSSKESLLGYARQIKGLNAAAVKKRVNNSRKKWESDVEAEKQRGQKEGFSNTPGFVVYHRESGQHSILRGAQPYNRFESRIQALNKQP